ncbi:MAG: ferrous iron transport protein B [Gemmatimonadota bacterium]
MSRTPPPSSTAGPASALPPRSRPFSFALIGNPNTGKTTLFNALTGLSQRVANYPGVTVEGKSGLVALAPGRSAVLHDLPGAYSLAAHAPDEMVAVDVLMGQQPGTDPVDAVLAIADASNLRRNLYLVSQLLEVGLPVVLALNMVDVAAARGIEVDAAVLARNLGVPVVPVCAQRREGVEELRQAMSAVMARRQLPSALPALPEGLRAAAAALHAEAAAGWRGLSQLEAFRALVDEGGYAEVRMLARLGPGFAARLAARRQAAGGSLATAETEARYLWIDGVLAGCLRQPEQLQTTTSDRVDRIVTHPYLGLLVFAAVGALVFNGVYRWATPMMDGIEILLRYFSAWLAGIIPDGALRSLLLDGVIAGVGGVLTFLPQIGILFFFIAILEDCGYMSRAAFLMDRLLTLCGLSGRSFIPLLSSFACAVPGILAARTIENRRDRFVTILVAPLMSCSARLPIYVLFIAAFVPERQVLGGWVSLQALTLLALYVLGAVLAVPIAWVLKQTVLRGETPPFLLELPSYKVPDLRTIGLRVYHSMREFVVRAGSIIMAATVVMWALAYFPRPEPIVERFAAERASLVEAGAEAPVLAQLRRAEAAELLSASYLGRGGRLIEPVVAPLGWDWRIGMATLAAFPAREIVISVLGTVYSLGGDHDQNSEALRHALRSSHRPDGRHVINLPVALSIMVFFALCAQCMSTLAAIQRETRSWLWPGLAFVYMTALAYLGAYATHHAAHWLGWG